MDWADGYGIIYIRTLWNKHLGFKILQNVSVRDNRLASCIFMMNVVSPPEDGQNTWPGGAGGQGQCINEDRLDVF